MKIVLRQPVAQEDHECNEKARQYQRKEGLAVWSFRWSEKHLRTARIQRKASKSAHVGVRMLSRNRSGAVCVVLTPECSERCHAVIAI